jgi:glycosyltransferase involved in cell wall biosynthesis
MLFEDDVSIFEKAARLALRIPDVVTSADEYRADILRSTKPSPREVITVKNVPLSSQIPSHSIPRKDRFSTVYFGAMGEGQSLDTIVRSIPDWPEEATLDLYGNPTTDFRLHLDRIATDLGVGDRVTFKGWIKYEDLFPTIASYHLGFSIIRPLYPHFRFCAGASNKRFHLMCAGVPQISDNSAGVPELIEQNQVGVCVDPEVPEDIAKHVRAYYEDRVRIEREAVAARELIATNLNMETEFKKLIDRSKTVMV